MDRRNFLHTLSAGAGALALPIIAPVEATATPQVATSHSSDREYWAKLLNRMVTPVVTNLAHGSLRRAMPTERGNDYSPHPDATYIEALGRTTAGIAPWLALPDDTTNEGAMRRKLREDTLQGVANAVAPDNPDKMNFGAQWQPIVDSAYLAHAFLRAPKALWEPLDTKTKQRVIAAFISLRDRKPWYNNWLLFAAMTETFLRSVDAPWDPMRVDYALNKIEEWYLGDGFYGDGSKFTCDYYNSYVIHPMMVDILAVHARFDEKNFKERHAKALKRMQRYGNEQERLISPEGTYPPLGRSITYRTGAFQALAQLALMEKLPEGVSGAQVRSALTAVYRRMYEHPGTFDKDGWLTLGFVGHQQGIADYYTSTGSLYMATLSFLPLGLPASHPFWTSPAEDWTAKKAWAGELFRKDYHVDY